MSVIHLSIFVCKRFTFLAFSPKPLSEPILIKQGKSQPLVKMIKAYSNNGIHLPPNRNNSQIVKIQSQLLKICRTIQTISIKHGTKQSCVKGFQVCLNEGPWG